MAHFLGLLLPPVVELGSGTHRHCQKENKAFLDHGPGKGNPAETCGSPSPLMLSGLRWGSRPCELPQGLSDPQALGNPGYPVSVPHAGCWQESQPQFEAPATPATNGHSVPPPLFATAAFHQVAEGDLAKLLPSVPQRTSLSRSSWWPPKHFPPLQRVPAGPESETQRGKCNEVGQGGTRGSEN